MIISGAIDTGIPDITVVIRENSDANKVLVDTPNITVNVQQGSNYNVNIQPNSLVVQRTGSLPSIAVSAYSASYALTASYIEGDIGIVEWDEIANKPLGIVSSSKQYPGWVTSSTQIDYNQIRNKSQNIVSSSIQIKNLLPSGVVSSSKQYPGWVTASSQIDYNQIQNKPSASATASYALTALTASYAHVVNLPTIDIDTHAFNASGFVNTFTLSQSYDLNSLEVFVGGIALIKNTDFTITGSTLTLLTTPPSESNVLVRAYVNSSDGSTGTFYGTFIGNLVGSIQSASFAQTASYALNAGAGAGFPYSGSAVITGSLIMVDTGNEGGITGSLFGTASVADGFDIVFAGEYETGSTTPLVNGWSPLSASYALTASHINEIVLSANIPLIPKTGSVYFSSSFIYVYDGTQYRSASLN
jgi:hypothetical protein